MFYILGLDTLMTLDHNADCNLNFLDWESQASNELEGYFLPFTTPYSILFMVDW